MVGVRLTPSNRCESSRLNKSIPFILWTRIVLRTAILLLLSPSACLRLILLRWRSKTATWPWSDHIWLRIILIRHLLLLLTWPILLSRRLLRRWSTYSVHRRASWHHHTRWSSLLEPHLTSVRPVSLLRSRWSSGWRHWHLHLHCRRWERHSWLESCRNERFRVLHVLSKRIVTVLVAHFSFIDLAIFWSVSRWI